MVSGRKLIAWNGRRYRALLSQAGTAAPTAIVLNNSIGKTGADVVWARTGVGVYTATLTAGFTANKTFIHGRVYDQATGKALVGARTSANVLTFTHGVVAGAASDVFTNVEVEFEVYE